MQRIIDFANKTIDTCVHCKYQSSCHWFVAAAENVVLDDITPEQYASMTYEEIANKNFENSGVPLECYQVSFDDMMLKVEDLLEEADMPYNSRDLVAILNKMSRLERRLLRIDPEARDVFDAPIRAIVERCLAAIDYHFLYIGVDVSALIEDIHKNYHRSRMLSQFYLGSAVKVLLSKACKPTIEQIVSCQGELSQLIPPEPLPPYPLPPGFYEVEPASNKASEDNQKKDEENNIPEAEPSKSVEIKNTVKKHSLDIPKGLSAVEEVILRFAGWPGKDPITAFLIKAGYSDFVFGDMWDVEGITQEEWADANYDNWKRYQFTRWAELKAELSAEIKTRVNDELELKKYICGLITPFDRFYYFDRVKTDIKALLEAENILDCFTFPPSFSIEQFMVFWREVINKLREDDETENYSLEDYVKEIRKRYDERLFDEAVDEEVEEALAFETRLRFPDQYCGLIAGCLLENGAKLEYMDYQDMCGVNLVPQLDSWQVSRAMGWTEELVFSYNPKRIEQSCFYSYENDDEKPSSNENETVVKVSFGDILELPTEFQSRKAAEIWEKAFKVGLIDEHFHFKGSQVERALFAGDLSMALFGKIDWITIGKWDKYRYFPQKYGIISVKHREDLSEHGKLIYDLFA